MNKSSKDIIPDLGPPYIHFFFFNPTLLLSLIPKCHISPQTFYRCALLASGDFKIVVTAKLSKKASDDGEARYRKIQDLQEKLATQLSVKITS